MHGVDVYGWQRGCKLGLGVHALIDKVAVHEQENFVHALRYINRLSVQLAFLEEKAEAANDLAGTLHLVDDVAENLPQLVKICRVTGQETLRGLGVAENGGQRLIQFVGDRTGQLSEHQAARGAPTPGAAIEFPAPPPGGE